MYKDYPVYKAAAIQL